MRRRIHACAGLERALPRARPSGALARIAAMLAGLAMLAAPADATATVYSAQSDTSTYLIADGSCSLPGGNATVKTDFQWKTTFATASSTSPQTAMLTAGSQAGTWISMGRVYAPAYIVPTIFSSPSSYVSLASTNASDQWQVFLKDYDPNGALGNGVTLRYSTPFTAGYDRSTSYAFGSTPNPPPNTTQVPWASSGYPPPIPAGHRLMMEIFFMPAVSGDVGGVWMQASTTIARLTVDESAFTGYATILGDNLGSEAPAGGTVCPGDPGKYDVDHFTLSTFTASGSTSYMVSKLAVWTSNTSAIQTLYITSDDGLTTYFSGDPNSLTNGVATLSPTIFVNTTPAQYRIKVTPKSYSSLTPGTNYTIGVTVSGPSTCCSGWPCTTLACNNKGYDFNSGNVTVLRTPPSASPTWGTVTPLAGETLLNWTNPTTNYANTVILRSANNANPAVATALLNDGQTYAQGQTGSTYGLGADTVAYGGNGASATDLIGSGGGKFAYRAFAADACLNYSSPGANAGPYTVPSVPNPTTIGTLTATVNDCSSVTLVANFSGDGDNSNTVTFKRNDGTTNTAVTCGSSSRTPSWGGSGNWTCIDYVPSANKTYTYTATFADTLGGVVGTNPATATPVTETTCPVNGGQLTLGMHPNGNSLAVSANPGQTNVLAGRFKLTAAAGDVFLTQILLSNPSGTATATDIGALDIYADTGGMVGSWDGGATTGDQLVAVAHYSPTANAWISSGFKQTGTTNYLVTLSPAYGSQPGRTFALSFSISSIGVTAPATVNVPSSQSINSGAVTITAVPAGQSPGDPTGNRQSLKPMVLILNPANGTTMSLDNSTPSKGLRVQVQVYDSSHTSITSNSVKLSHDGGTPDTLSLNSAYDAVVNPGIAMPCYDATLNPGGAPCYAHVFQGDLPIPAGNWTLQAQATTSGGGTAYSAPVVISVNPQGMGDGNLLVRNDSAQLCIDCHVLQTHSSQAMANPAGRSKYGAWGVNCRDCHAPHKTRNAQLIAESIVPPAYSSYQTAKTVRFRDHKTGDSGSSSAVSFVTSSVTLTSAGTFGPCQACHTRTGNALGSQRWRNTGNTDLHYVGATTLTCTKCHSHARGFAGRESVGGEYCGACHDNFAGMQSTTHLTKHTIGPTVLGTNDNFVNTNVTWGSPLASSVSTADRSCVNMCHGDHVHNDPSAWPAQTHNNNFYLNPLTQASRALSRDANSANATYGLATSGSTGSGYLRTDFVSGQYGQGCLACHTSPVDSKRPAIDGAKFDASAHDVTTTPAGTKWEYVLHDDNGAGSPSRFTRNCTKCHAGSAEGTTPSWFSTVQGPHYSDYPSLLAGGAVPQTGPGADNSVQPANFVCYNCHGSGAKLSRKDVFAITQSVYRHPVNLDYSHDTVNEAAVTFGGIAYSGAKRHANCIDCHGPHVAGKTKVNRAATADLNRNKVPAGSPLLGATGIQYGPVAGKSYPAFPATGAWPASTAANYGDAVVTQPTYEYEVCFKCHTAFAYGGTAASDTGFGGPSNAGVAGTSGQAETDLGMEFSPTMASGHPVVASLNNYTGSSAPRALDASRLLPPWSTNIGNQTMLCTDCHNADSVAPAVQGPHGSAYTFMLAGVNKRWPIQKDGTTQWGVTNSERDLGTSNGLFCRNCHPQMTTSFIYNPATGDPKGTNWAHAWVGFGHWYDNEGPLNRCISCHVAIPHGSKLGRLIITTNAPARYRIQTPWTIWNSTINATFATFRKGNTPSASDAVWTASCIDPTSGKPLDHTVSWRGSLGTLGGDTW